MSRTHRLLELLQELRARRCAATAQSLAAALGISVRTLYRDINALRAEGAEIEGAAGFGYVLRPGFLLPPLMFTADEIDVLLLGASWVAQRQDIGLAAPARGTLAKIAAVLPQGMADAFDLSGLLVGPVRQVPPPCIDVAAIRDALRRERKLSIAYVDGKAGASQRIIWPVALGVFDDMQLLAAWCELRADYRHFRLDRMRAVQVLPARMPRRRRAMQKEWRLREAACLPPGIHEGAH